MRAVATMLFAMGIAGLFFLDRGGKAGVSGALWIPTAWLCFGASRSVSQWLQISPPVADPGSVYLQGSPVDRTLFAILEILALIVLLIRRRQVGAILRGNWAIGLFFFYAANSIAWSDYPTITLKHWIKGIGDVMMAAIVLTEPSVAEAVKRLVTRLGFVLLPLSILFIRYYPALGRIPNNSWMLEPVGVCTQKNGLGQLCTIFGLGLLWRFRAIYHHRADPGRTRRLVALGAVLAMVVYLLWLCNSLTSISALCMASAVMLLSTRPIFGRQPALIHVVVLAMVALSLYALFFQSSGSLVRSLGRSPTLSGRTAGWAVMLSVPVNRLVGTGYESFWLGPRLRFMPEAFPGAFVGQAHNGYIDMLLTLGWIGVTLLAVVIATGYQIVIGAWRRDPEVGSLMIAFFFTTVISGLTEAVFRMMSPTCIIFLLAILSGSVIGKQKRAAVVASTPDLMKSWSGS